MWKSEKVGLRELPIFMRVNKPSARVRTRISRRGRVDFYPVCKKFASTKKGATGGSLQTHSCSRDSYISSLLWDGWAGVDTGEDLNIRPNARVYRMNLVT